jgi:hypothetical protein
VVSTQSTTRYHIHIFFFFFFFFVIQESFMPIPQKSQACREYAGYANWRKRELLRKTGLCTPTRGRGAADKDEGDSLHGAMGIEWSPQNACS